METRTKVAIKLTRLCAQIAVNSISRIRIGFVGLTATPKTWSDMSEDEKRQLLAEADKIIAMVKK